MNYRINAQGNVMAYGLDNGFGGGMWTTLPPKKGRFVLACMSRKQLLNLIQIVAVPIALAVLEAAARV